MTLVKNQQFLAYDRPNGRVMHKGQLNLPKDYQLGAQWVHEESLHFASSFKTNGKLTVNIQTIQPASVPPNLTVKSFPVPPLDGCFSFSPASFHASFVTRAKIIILDVQNSKVLLNTGVTQVLYEPQGQFSLDGRFFMCGTLGHEHICIWRHTPTCFVPWSTVQPRLPLDKFLFSPTATSIVTWGSEGVQLLCPGGFSSSPPPNKVKSLQQHGNHLVAPSADGTCIATAQRGGSVVTVLDSLSGGLQWSIHTGVQVQSIGIADNTLFVVDGHKLISWNLGAWGGVTTSGSCGTVAVGVHMDKAKNLTLSNDCSKIAFTVLRTVFLYDITAQAMLTEHIIRGEAVTIQFSQDGHWLYAFTIVKPSVFSVGQVLRGPTYYLTKFKVGGDGSVVGVTTEQLEDWESWVRLVQPRGYCVEIGSCWLVDSGGCKHLWLPPGWRTKYESDVRWEGNFLGLVGSHCPRPIVIELQPPSLLPHLPPTPILDISMPPLRPQFPSISSPPDHL